MKRRKLLKNTLLASGAIPFLDFESCIPESSQLQNYGIQLFSLPKMLEKDLRGAMKMISGMGYKEIELYGPFPFSSDSVKNEWNSITPQLGFEGSGFFNRSLSEFHNILNEFDLKPTSAHLDLETLQTRMPQLGEAARVLGLECVGIPLIPADKRTSLDDYKRMADEFNVIGELANKDGLKYIYHNHGYGLKEIDGIIPLNLIIERTDPDLVFLELDIYWTTAGGANPVDYLNSYPGRYLAMHLKDMKELVYFEGDGGTPDEWIELFPFMTTVGNGVLDIETIVKTGQKLGVKHFYVEQDMVDQPEIALKKSIDYLLAI